jgi:hypothetical protein
MRRFWVPSVAILLMAGCSESDSSSESNSPTSQTTPSQTGGQQSTEQTGFATPRAAFDAMKAATLNDDFAGAVRCMSPDSQKTMAALITFPLAMIAAFDPDKEKEIAELLQRHGVSLDDESEEFPIDQIPDRIAFIADVIQWMEANADEGDDDSGPMDQMADGTLGEVTIDGDSAHAAFTAKSGETEVMEFVRIDGRWFLELPNEMAGDGSFSGLDEPDMSFGAGFSGGFGFDDRPPTPVEAVTVEDFAAGWQVTIQEKDVPAQKILARIADELGLEFIPDAVGTKIDQLVSVDRSMVSQLEVIESICADIEVTPVFVRKSLTLEPGRRSAPVVFSGPFMAHVTQVDTDPESATGVLTLQVIGAGLPAGILQAMEADFAEPITVEDVVNGEDETLFHPVKTRMSYAGGGAAAFDRKMFVGLKNLVRSVSEIHEARLLIAFTLPTEVAVLRFDDLKTGATQESGDVTLTLSETDGSSFTFEYSGVADDGGGEAASVQIIAYDSMDEPIQPIGSSSFGAGDSGTITRGYENSPAHFEARIVTAFQPVEYTMTVAGIPLPNHDQMPESLPELSFDGDSPMTLEFVRIAGDENFREAVFRATNHTNKVVEALELTMQYLDENGDKLEDQIASASEDPVPPGGTQEFEVAAYFMPDETKTVGAVLESIEFSDASNWFAEE